MNIVKNHRFYFCIGSATIDPEAQAIPQDEQDQTMNSISQQLTSALDRQRSLRARGGNFGERASLQSEIHGLRASLRHANPGRRP